MGAGQVDQHSRIRMNSEHHSRPKLPGAEPHPGRCPKHPALVSNPRALRTQADDQHLGSEFRSSGPSLTRIGGHHQVRPQQHPSTEPKPKPMWDAHLGVTIIPAVAGMMVAAL